MYTAGILVDSLTHRCGELIFEYEYLRDFEAKIGTARMVV
jgi:NADH:ubiquinone oxidoreductase subunit F (NADH-binding)